MEELFSDPQKAAKPAGKSKRSDACRLCGINFKISALEGLELKWITSLKTLPAFERRAHNWLDKAHSGDAYINWNLLLFLNQDIISKSEAFHFNNELVWVDLLLDDAT